VISTVRMMNPPSPRPPQYTRALGSKYLTSLVIVCACTGR
jgi:hypothetical protein